MQIVLKHATAEDVWNQIIGTHTEYHQGLKYFGYGYSMFVPNDPRLHEMFEIEHLTDEQTKHYHDIVVNEIYNINDLNKFDDMILNQVIPMVSRGVEKLKPMLKSWGATLPDELEIMCHYGRGGAYWYSEPNSNDPNRIVFRCTNFHGNHIGMAQLFMHELIHILIELPIIKKYHVPQDLKERIVDIIGFEFFGKPVQPPYENSFANAYITLDAIKTGLPGAVARMMNDYNARQQKQVLER